MEVRAALHPRPASVAAARELVGRALRGCGCADSADVAVLLVSELVTNAVQHARSEIWLRVRVDRGLVRVEVTDHGWRPAVASGWDEPVATGRGLHLVAALSHSWGVEEDEAGTVVWFTVLGEGLSETA